jgi:hypothetical protein
LYKVNNQQTNTTNLSDMLFTLLPLLALLPFATPSPTPGGGGGPGHGGPGGPSGGPHHGGPPDHGGQTCPDNNCLSTSVRDFGWDLTLEYRAFWYFTNPAHQNSWGHVNFTLKNPAVASTISCQYDSDRLTDFFYGDFWMTCVPTPAVPAITSTYFKFFTHSKFELNQTWVCDDKDPKTAPVKFNAIAATALDMKCTDVSWQNPNWTQGSGAFYSTRDVKCAPVSLKLKPYGETIVLS